MFKIAQQKLAQAAQYLKEADIDLWLIYASEGSDPAVSLMMNLKTVGRTFFLLTKEGRRVALCSSIDALESENSGLFDEVVSYGGDPVAELHRLVEEIAPRKIALNYSKDDNLCDGLTTGRYRYLCKALPEYVERFVSSEPMLQKIRSIKTSEEIATIRKAVEITLEIFDEVFATMKAGMTEYEIGQLFVDGMSRRGVTSALTKDLDMPIVMKERIAHRDPGDAVLQGGDFLIMDFGVDYNGYCSDISRTAYFLKPGETEAPERFRHIFATAHEAISRAFAVAKPGVEGRMVDKAARDYIVSCGFPEITHATGQQIGRFEHDGGMMFAPEWKRYGDAPYGIIQPNMLFTLEPTILMPEGDYSVLCEEDICITETGAEFISKRQMELVLIPPRDLSPSGNQQRRNA